MAAIQFEFRAGIVVEVPQLPITGIVAIATLCAEPLAMDVVALVAGLAGGRRVLFVERSRMAVLASGRPVFAQQRIGGVPVMIESQRLPALFGMAPIALLTKG